MAAKIIDFRVTPPFDEYATFEEARYAYQEGYMARYKDTYGADMNLLQTDMKKLLNDMDEGGVAYSVLQGEWVLGDYKKMNDAVYRIAKQYPDKFPYYFMGIDTGTNDDLPRYIEEQVKERGFTGVTTCSWAVRHYMTDKLWYPIYAKCQELGVAMTFHTSINFTVDRPLSMSHPMQLSEIASAFPELVIIAAHGGWPWVTEMVAVAWKHKHVYIELGAQSPKYIAKPGTGWDPLVVFGNSVIQDKVLFATDTMLPPQRVIQELRDMPLKDSVKDKWLGLNAERLLGSLRQHA